MEQFFLCVCVCVCVVIVTPKQISAKHIAFVHTIPLSLNVHSQVEQPVIKTTADLFLPHHIQLQHTDD